MTINATHSTFNNNGRLSGSSSNISTIADNNLLGASENAAVSAGVFTFNDSSNESSIIINAIHSSFDKNGSLSGVRSLFMPQTLQLITMGL